MGRYWDRFMVRNDYVFDNLINQVVKEHAENIIRTTGSTSPYDDYRVATAGEVIKRDNPRGDLFRATMKDRVVLQEAFLTAAFENAEPDASGIPQPRVMDVDDDLIDTIVIDVWDDVADVVWTQMPPEGNAPGNGSETGP